MSVNKYGGMGNRRKPLQNPTNLRNSGAKNFTFSGNFNTLPAKRKPRKRKDSAGAISSYQQRKEKQGITRPAAGIASSAPRRCLLEYIRIY
jgi:hypothetical protein